MSNSTLLLEEPANVIQLPAREPKKWTSTAGPIQTKKVSKALSAISQEHSCKVEKWGVIGGEEHESCMYSLFGGAVRADVREAQCDIGEKFAWTITRDNYNDIIADCEAVFPKLKAGRPVDDKRKTPEQETEQRAKMRQFDEERKAKDDALAKEKETHLAVLRAKYPWASRSDNDCTRASANAKRLLSEAFPGTSFSVRLDRYSGGNNISFSWTLGPTTKQVDELINPFRRGSFNSMDEIYENDTRAEEAAFHEWMGATYHIHTGREIPNDWRENVAKSLCEYHLKDYVEMQGYERPPIYLISGDDKTAHEHALTLLHETNIPAGSTFEGVEPFATNEPGNWLGLKLKLKAPDVAPKADDCGSSASANWRENHIHHGIEIRFSSKPDSEMITKMKSNGWRSKRETGGWFWYKKDSDSTRAFAKQICG